ncbi:unnamed protein product [Parascedosporium putredinis]|uniref:Uncharacterized protein n=1 Tax=Parascedosporium putredinis TaxID=1442378 RepID=A0A9P1MCJ5_9PEZI|nr:unnamed protein product [Parascedosporium putredinis]CAI8000815.1 unnamed protein product [Parascedosporium putredinis]
MTRYHLRRHAGGTLVSALGEKLVVNLEPYSKQWVLQLDPGSYSLTADEETRYFAWCPDPACKTQRNWEGASRALSGKPEFLGTMAEEPKPLAAAELAYPRVTIEYCTQCKWMLRAAYFAQELLSTFQADLAEVTLRPSRGGTFVISIATAPVTDPALSSPTTAKVLWDRTVDGGFPETKELKRRVRDVIDPGRNLGHNDRHHGPAVAERPADAPASAVAAGVPIAGATSCVPGSGEDCRTCE